MDAMKAKCLLCVALVSALAMQVWAQAPRMKMTTPVPEGIATPDTLETSLGTLTSFDGVPDVATTQTKKGSLGLDNRKGERRLTPFRLSLTPLPPAVHPPLPPPKSWAWYVFHDGKTDWPIDFGGPAADGRSDRRRRERRKGARRRFLSGATTIVISA